MAHIAHFKQSDIKRLCNEYEREEELNNRDGRIDLERTKDNYQLPSGRRIRYQLEYDVSRRVSEVPHSNRKDLNVMSTWIVTLPDELKDADDEAKRKFFEVTYSFTQQRYGSDNVMLGYVHMDETSPHIHIPLIPVNKNGRISSKNVFTRKELSGYHKELDALMEKEFGMKGLILNGRTKGNYTVQELKERTKQEKILSEKQDALDKQESVLDRRAASLDAREARLKAQEDAFETQKAETSSELQNELKKAQRRNASLDAREARLKAQEDGFEVQKGKILSELQNELKKAQNYVNAADSFTARIEKSHPNMAKQFRQFMSSTSEMGRSVADASRIIKDIPDCMKSPAEEGSYYSL